MKSIVLLVLISFFSCSKTKMNFPKAEKGVIDLGQWVGHSQRVADPLLLEGEWEFYWKEFYSSEDFNNPNKKEEIEGKREYMKVPGSIPDRPDMEKSGIGYGTYRLLIKGENLEKFTHLHVELILTAFRVYSNGVLVSELGKVTRELKNAQGIEKASVIKLENLQNNNLEIIFHVSNFHHYRSGIVSIPKIGDETAIYKEKQLILNNTTFFFGSFFVLSLYHLGLFLLRRSDLSPLYFSIITFLLGIRPFLTNKYIVDDYPFLSWGLLFRIEYLTVSLPPSIFVLFFQTIFPLEISKRIPFILLSFAFVLSAVVIFGSIYQSAFILSFIQILAIICAFVCIWILILAIRKKREGSISLLIGMSFLILCVINDILHQNEIIHTGYYLSYGLFVFIFSQAYLLSVRFSNAFKESEEQRSLLAQAKLEIENLSRTKDEFLSNLSHEIKTPLSVVYTYSQMLPNQKENPKKIEKYTDQIYANATKLNDYVSDLLLVTDIESNLELQKSNVSLKDILEAGVSPLSGLLEEKSIRLEMSEIPEITLNCDSALLKKAIQAVLKNAIVYNKVNGKINTTIRIESNQINIHITDTGIGIDPKMQERIFDKFFRIDSSLTYEVSGVGIGLFLAKKILELHGGKIGVESELGVGSTFVMEIPVKL